MRKRKVILFSVPLFLAMICLPLASVSCATVGIEKVQYDVVGKGGSIEIRQYKPYLVAETRVDSDFKKAGNVAFRWLFDYISGANRSQHRGLK